MDYSQIFYIDPPDDIEKVKTKIEETKKRKVILVLPEENKNLKSIEKLTILKKETQRLDKHLAIFSTDPQYRRLAEDCGIEIEDSLIGGSFFEKGELSFRPKVRDILPKGEVPAPKKEIEKKTEKEKLSGEEEKVVTKKKKWPLYLIYSLFFIFIVGGVLYSLIWLPKADIVIIPTGEDIEFSGRFIVKKDAVFDIETKTIPGNLIEKEKKVEKSFLATGSEKRRDKARGIVTIYNEHRQINLILGTRLESPGGKVFKSEDRVSIPAGSKEDPAQTQVEIVAAEAGSEYNIEPTTFLIPGLKGTEWEEKVYAKSTEKTSGGFIGEAKVVTKEDLEKAKEEMARLEENLVDEAKSEVLKELSPILQFLENEFLIERDEVAFDRKVGEIRETFKGRARVAVKILSFNENDVQKIIAGIIADKVKDDIDFEEVISSQEIQYKVLQNNIDGGIIEISFEGKEKVAWKIDIDEIKKRIPGQDGIGFEKYIREDMVGKIEKADLKLWPFWVNKIPERESRIFIEVKYE
jgi:hypothetical protein